MRKIIGLIALVMMLLLSSCAASFMPHGKWENTDLGVILDVNSDIDPGRGFPGFFGTYMKDDEKIDIFIFLSLTHGTFAIWKECDVPYRGGPDYDLALYSGDFRWLRGDQLRLRLAPLWQERTGLEEIVFERIEDYR